MKGLLYTIAKAANIAMAKCIAMEYGSSNIRAYTHAFDDIATLTMYYSVAKKIGNAVEEHSINKRDRPEEVIKVAKCIASDDFFFYKR